MRVPSTPLMAHVAQASMLILLNLGLRIVNMNYYLGLILSFIAIIVTFNLYVYLRGSFGGWASPLWVIPTITLAYLLFSGFLEGGTAEALGFMVGSVMAGVFGESEDILRRAEFHRGVLMGFLFSFLTIMYFRLGLIGAFLMGPILEYLLIGVVRFEGIDPVLNGVMGGLLVATLPIYSLSAFPYVVTMVVAKHIVYDRGASMWIVALDYMLRPFVMAGGVLWSIGILY